MPKKQVLELTETPILKCLRCGSPDTQVVREIEGEGNSWHVDVRCVSCREQFVLKHPAYYRQ